MRGTVKRLKLRNKDKNKVIQRKGKGGSATGKGVMSRESWYTVLGN